MEYMGIYHDYDIGQVHVQSIFKGDCKALLLKSFSWYPYVPRILVRKPREVRWLR